MNFSNKDKILVVAAHPDEILGCGGTLAKAILNKAKVRVLFLEKVFQPIFQARNYLSNQSKKNIRETAKKAKIYENK